MIKRGRDILEETERRLEIDRAMEGYGEEEIREG